MGNYWKRFNCRSPIFFLNWVRAKEYQHNLFSYLIVVVQSFFLFWFLPKTINVTILTLVPKQTDALEIKDFWPIACCNLVYKIISNIIADKLKKMLTRAIVPNQCTFVKGPFIIGKFLVGNKIGERLSQANYQL